MRLRVLTEALEAPAIVGADDVDIASIQSDSRQVTEGALFVAVRGTAVDGHSYIESAIGKGAVAVVCEEIPEEALGKCTFVRVRDSAEALGLLVSRWYGDPSRKLTLVGVTGTNGKTTIATLLYEMFRKMGHKAGLISTVRNYVDGEAIPTEHTTPDPLTLHALMARMVEAGCEYAFMEVSSHAIDQRRISGLAFDGGIFTNLTRDHLDYHKTVENYLRAKKRFFDDLPAGAFALTNADDKSGLVMLQNTKARKLTYSLRSLADFKGKIRESHFEGTDLLINGREVTTRFVGRFNAYNLLAVYGAAVTLGADPEEALVVLSTLRSVAGRFETIPSPSGYTAIVDYAHNAVSMESLLKTLRAYHPKRLVCVFGCGGNRAKERRYSMGEIGGRLADFCILTADNPRFEKNEDIIKDIEIGMAKTSGKYMVIPDRKEAILYAVRHAETGDMIAVIGKGHEDYQEIEGVRHHFLDREIVEEAVRETE